MPVIASSGLVVDLAVALLGTAESWPLLLFVLFVIVPAVWSRDARRRSRARQVLLLLRRPRGADEEPHP